MEFILLVKDFAIRIYIVNCKRRPVQLCYKGVY